MLIVTKGLPTFILLGFSLDGQNFSGHLYDLFVGAGFNLAWLAVPVVLATWQYGRRGLSVTMTVVVAGNLLAVLLPENNTAGRAALVVDLAGRLAIIGLVAIVVEWLAASNTANKRCWRPPIANLRYARPQLSS